MGLRLVWRYIERLLHSADQSSGRERFRNTPVAAVSILDIAGDKDHWQLRVEFQNTIGEIEAVHARHQLRIRPRNLRPDHPQQ